MIDTKATANLGALLDQPTDLRTVYQPIVELDGGATVGFEALTRGPRGSSLEAPDDLFALARRAGRVEELDAACFRNAVERAASWSTPPQLLFVNVEPGTLTSRLVRRTAPIPAAGGLPIVLEVTERALTASPATLMAGVHEARDHGWSIALDDVGADPTSLAFLSLLRPDVVKLDMALIRNRADEVLGRTMAAVMAHAERTGAVILAEGIETDDHLERAISLGATLGQGWRFGRPGELPALMSDGPAVRLPPSGPPRPTALSPFDAVVGQGTPTRVGRKHVLLQISHHLESRALVDSASTLLLSAFQDVRHFTPDTARRYRDLAERCALVEAVGTGLPPCPAPGVRGTRITVGDPLVGEWSVVVLGPHYAGALLGHDLGDTGADADRRFRYVVTHDRSLVEQAAESLLRRVAGAATD
jgi:EAL domain-containing protein (putative c-di-GMP-specific phosphodiesterase class I)